MCVPNVNDTIRHSYFGTSCDKGELYLHAFIDVFVYFFALKFSKLYSIVRVFRKMCVMKSLEHDQSLN